MSLKPSFRENKPGWYACNRSYIKQIIRRQAKFIILGDSIVANLARYPCVWDQHLHPFNTVNCGGDRTQHVLWRAHNMYLPDIAHSVIGSGIKLRVKHSHLKIVVVGILPRDRDISKIRKKIQQTNEILKQVCWKLNFAYIEPANKPKLVLER